ncbi:ADP-ribose pyrophosphatase [Asanoa hainanensis]|uniref:ADP-ribose pyrophosphatase n=1 Tax=Asanoa hainanensis TaxID=560556 RepID=A0A239NZF6_9ACTN|nr:NUDIX hydrolase [Asanoa hainanensis]SNT60130.1 ADP-ribose pyrophosphatase [Asanoa hainanensis]
MTSLHAYAVLDRVERFHGKIFSVVTDRVTMPGGGQADRDYVRHVGAVGVVPLDDEGRVLLVRQYRHPVGKTMWELPAGLVDVAGEAPTSTADRELAEEADLRCERLDLLVDLHTSPGFSDELIRVFLARGLSSIPEAERFQRSDEEAEITVEWVPLDEAVAMALRSEITNAAAVAGLLATARARDEDWRPLRDPDTPLVR